MSHSRQQLLVAFIIILALLVPLWPAFDKAATPMDEGTLLVYPELILKGQLPYRDFETFYGPANLWVLAGAYSLFGTSVGVERAVGLLYRLLILAAVFVVVRRWNTIIAAGCLTIAGFLVVPMALSAFAWLGAIVCVLWSLCSLARTDSDRRCFFGGMLASGALLYRLDLAPAVAISALPFFLMMTPGRRWKYLAGAAMGLLPLAWLTLAAGPMQTLNNLFLYPVLHCSASRRMPIFSAQPYLIGLLLVHLLAALFNVVAGAVAVRADRKDPKARLLLAVALLSLGLSHQAVQRIDSMHVLFAAFLSFGILPLAIWTMRAHWSAVAPRSAHSYLAVAIVAVLLETFTPELVAYWRSEITAALSQKPEAKVFALDQHERSYPLNSNQVAEGAWKVLHQLERYSKPGERLFVGPADLRRTNYNDTYLYYMAPKLIPASYFLEMNPASANRPDSRLAADVASADWLILSHTWDDWSEPNESSLFRSDAPARVVRAQFEIRGHFGEYDLYQRKATVSAPLNAMN